MCSRILVMCTPFFILFSSSSGSSCVIYHWNSLAAVRTQMRDRWKRASTSKDDVSAIRWKHLKQTLENKKLVMS